MKDRVVFLGFQDTIDFTRCLDCVCDGKWECRCGYYTRDSVTNQSEAFKFWQGENVVTM